jgi:hypothetical protein
VNVSQELQLRRPADIVPTRQATRPAPEPLDPAVRVVLQLFTVLCALGALYMIWVAATGHRP